MKEQLPKSSLLNDFAKQCYSRHAALVNDPVGYQLLIKEATIYVDCCKEYPPVEPKPVTGASLDLTHIFRFNEMTVESTYFNGYFWITEKELPIYMLMT